MPRKRLPRPPVDIAAGKLRQLAGLRKGNQRAQLEVVPTVAPTKPVLSAAAGADFVKLLMAGVPAIDALRYLSPAYWDYCPSVKARYAWLVEVQASSFVQDATDLYLGSAWQDLEPNDRLQIALDKHYAEMAHYLFTHNFSDLTADRGRMTEARETLVAKLENPGNGGGMFDDFLKSLAGRTDLAEPPTLQIADVARLMNAAPDDESDDETEH